MNQNRTLIGLNLAVFLMMLGVGMIMALLPQKIMTLTGSTATVGYLASAFALSYIILQVPIGSFSDRWGFKYFLTGGYLLCAFTGLIYYLANLPVLYFLGRILQGAGEAPIWALAPALLSIQYAHTKGKVMGVYNAILHLGLTIGPILGILLGRICQGNQPFLFYAVACLTGALIILWMVEDKAGKGMTQSQSFNIRNIASLMAYRNSSLTLAGITLYGAGYGIFLTNIPAFLIRFKDFKQLDVSFFFTLFYFAISISQLLTGSLSDRLGRKKFMIAGLIIAAAGITSFPHLGHPWINILLSATSLGLGVFYLSSMAYLNEVVPNSLKGTITGAYYLFWGIGFFFGPIVIGKATQWGSPQRGYQWFAMLLFVEAIIMMMGDGWIKFKTKITGISSKL